MKFKVDKASDLLADPIEVEINTLEDLMKLSKENHNHRLILQFTFCGEPQPNITIYDDYIE